MFSYILSQLFFLNFFVATFTNESVDESKIAQVNLPIGSTSAPLPVKQWSRTSSSSSYLPNPILYRFTPDKVADRLYKTMNNGMRSMNNISHKHHLTNGAIKMSSSNANITTSNATANLVAQKRVKNVSQPKNVDIFANITLRKHELKLVEEIYGDTTATTQEKHERLKQMSKWMSKNNISGKQSITHSTPQSGDLDNPADLVSILASAIIDKVSKTDQTISSSPSSFSTLVNVTKPEPLIAEHVDPPSTMTGSGLNNHKIDRIDEEDESNGIELSGSLKPPSCAINGRHYCTYKEDYPSKVVIEVTKYYKWPLEKLFRDLRHQIMPKLANDNYGGLVCDSVTRVVRPGWTKNTNNRWLVIINTDIYQQYVTEIVCRHGSNSRCNFIPPCYHAICKQRYNTQKLLVIDPWNPYKGPFLSEFLFPSCCICFVPANERDDHQSPIKFQGPHRRMDSTVVTDKMEL